MSDSNHFDGLLEDDDRSPAGFKKMAGVTDVLIDLNTGKVVITGFSPNTTHNCDVRGCGSIEHKIAEFTVDKDLFEPVRLHTENQQTTPENTS